MRLSSVLSKRGWLPERKVEFQEILPLKLRDRVSGKGEKGNESACVQEIMNLLACLKKNDYNQSACSKEVGGLDTCFKNHHITSQTHKEHMKLGILTPGAKELTSQQVNVLLKKFPSN